MTRSEPSAALVTRWDENLQVLMRNAAKLDLLAGSLNCLALTDSTEVRGLLRNMAAFSLNLKTCATYRDFFEGVSIYRPDIAIVGPDFSGGDLQSLLLALKTSGLGIVAVGHNDESITAVQENVRRIVVEPLEARCNATVVVYRVRALLRRCRPSALVQSHRYGDMILDEAALTIAIGKQIAPISLEWFRFIAPMFDDPEHVWTREELLILVYGSLTKNNIRTVDVKLNIIRRHLFNALGRDPVTTVHGQGYTLGVGH